MFSVERAYVIVSYADENGDKEAIEKFKIKEDSLRRARGLIRDSKIDKNKILVLDIETAPMRAYVWGMWKQYIKRQQIISDWFILSWSAKWIGSDKIYGEAVTSKEAKTENDLRILKDLSRLMNEANYIIAHHGEKFDFPRINARLALNNLPPISPYVTIDTCKWAKKRFGFTSNKLDDLCQSFGIGCKIDTSFELWEKCINGDKKSLDKMLEYNMQDVVLLEDLYIKIRPYVKGIPNISVSVTGDSNMVCTVCGSDDIMPDGYYITGQNIYRSYRCNSCGGIAGRERRSIVKDRNELVGAAR